MLREAVTEGTELGRAAKALMDSGRLVSDDLIIGIVKERLAKPDALRGFVLDGFPRTVAQADALDEMLDEESPLIVIDIEVSEDVLVRRLDARRICKVCGWTAPPGPLVCEKCGGELVQRRDDGAEVVRERLRVYGNESQPLVDFYRHRSTFRSVDGDQAPEAVAADISAAVASVLGDQP